MDMQLVEADGGAEGKVITRRKDKETGGKAPAEEMTIRKRKDTETRRKNGK